MGSGSKGVPRGGDAGTVALTSGQVSRLLGVDLKTVHNWVRRGYLHGSRTPGRHLRFRRAPLLRFMHAFGFPVPTELGRGALRAVLLTRRSSSFPALDAFREAPSTVEVDCPLRAALQLGVGHAEALIVDLSGRGVRSDLDLVRAVRNNETTHSLWVVGASGRRDAVESFLRAGGDLVLDSEQSQDAESLMRWLGGRSQVPPPRLLRGPLD